MKNEKNHSVSRRVFLAGGLAAPYVQAAQAARPNILWLTTEDIGPAIHACGDSYSVTPNIDRFAAKGCIYNNSWSNAPVCAPARTTIITGVYPPANGSDNMRSVSRMPSGWKMFPAYLRDAGYYCSNNVKEDYNLEKPEEHVIGTGLFAPVWRVSLGIRVFVSSRSSLRLALIKHGAPRNVRQTRPQFRKQVPERGAILGHRHPDDAIGPRPADGTNDVLGQI